METQFGASLHFFSRDKAQSAKKHKRRGWNNPVLANVPEQCARFSDRIMRDIFENAAFVEAPSIHLTSRCFSGRKHGKACRPPAEPGSYPKIASNFIIPEKA